MKTLQITEKDERTLLALFDLALKNPDSGGLNVLNAASYWVSKIQMATPAEEPKSQE